MPSTACNSVNTATAGVERFRKRRLRIYGKSMTAPAMQRLERAPTGYAIVDDLAASYGYHNRVL